MSMVPGSMAHARWLEMAKSERKARGRGTFLSLPHLMYYHATRSVVTKFFIVLNAINGFQRITTFRGDIQYECRFNNCTRWL